MSMITNRFPFLPCALFLVVGLALVGCDAASSLQQADVSADEDVRARQHASPSATHTYEVTIENLTVGQPFSPGLIVTHSKKAGLFKPGDPASDLIVNLAEDGLSDENVGAGVPQALINDLRHTPGVFEVVETGVPVDDLGSQPAPAPQPPSVATFTVTAAANANRLSMAVMLICTNDGFTGLNSVKLPGGFGPVIYDAMAYDAGSEQNTENFEDIVEPCQVIGPQGTSPSLPNGNNADSVPEDGGVITYHPGIEGIGDLEPDTDSMDRHGWDGPVARITIQRVHPTGSFPGSNGRGPSAR